MPGKDEREARCEPITVEIDASYVRNALNQLDIQHARHRLDGAGDLRRDLEASRQSDLDLGAATELKHHADFAVTLGVEALGDRLDRHLVAKKYTQAFLQLRGGLIERLGRLDAGADLVALRFGAEEQQHRRAGLQDI